MFMHIIALFCIFWFGLGMFFVVFMQMSCINVSCYKGEMKHLGAILTFIRKHLGNYREWLTFVRKHIGNHRENLTLVRKHLGDYMEELTFVRKHLI